MTISTDIRLTYLVADNLSAASFTRSDTLNQMAVRGIGKPEKFNLKKCHLSASDILLHAAHCAMPFVVLAILVFYSVVHAWHGMAIYQ